MSQSQSGGPKNAQNAGITTEIPSFLKQLARLIAQGFYQVEDALIVDMLVRNPCIKEKDLEDLLKFDLKLLRSRLATLKAEKIIQLRLRMETGLDGKAQKVNYYFINYKSLVNVIKYKLDHLRKRMETLERDATHRASFKCTNCIKTFTDLEAGELFDPTTLQFRCTFCYQLVEEDESAGPKTDSRFILARFNEQMQVIYDLLAKAEGIKLAPELLEPEPPRGSNDANNDNSNASGRDRGGVWSGEATRLQGTSDTRIDIKFGEARARADEERKERPVWLTESTIGEDSSSNFASTSAWNTNSESPSTSTPTMGGRAPKEDIMNVLLAYERKPGRSSSQPQTPRADLDFSSGSGDKGKQNINVNIINNHMSNFNTPNTSIMEIDGVEIMDSDDDDDDEDNAIPLVSVGSQKIPITEVNDEIIDKMTILEKETYSQQFQDYYANVFD